MQTLGLMFVAGVWMLQQMPALPGPGWLLPLAVFALILWLRRKRADMLQRLGWLTFAIAAGFMWAACAAHIRLADALPSTWEGRDIEVIGVVATLPQRNERGQRFEFDIEQVLTAGAVVPRHISISRYHTRFAAADGKVGIEERRQGLEVHAGERWRFTVRLKRPHGNLNPHGFDLEAWLLERDIRATGYVRDDDGNRLLQSMVPHPAYAAEAVRERIRTRMTAALEGREYAGILQALAIGDEAAIGQAQWEVFRRTGTSHLMSISGLHITMLAGLVFVLIYHLWRRSQRLTLRLPARKAATAASLATALLYAVVAGFSVPTQRTLYMLAVFAAALWFGRNLAVTRVLSYALVLVALLDPWAVLAPGFWLSFGAVAVIAFAAGGRLQSPHWLHTAANTQWAISLGLVPLLLVLFQQVSLVSPLANALAIPLVSFVVVPLTLLGVALPFDGLLHLSHWWMSVCMQSLQWLALLPASTWQQQAPPAWTLPLAVIGMLWLLLPRGFPLRWLGLAGLLPMLLLQPQLPVPGAMEVAVLDVGQGLAVVVRTAQHALLYDTGPRYSAQSDSGSRIVLPYLRAAGITQLDGLVVSHNDSDHSGGLHSILTQMPVGWLLSSLPATSTALGLVTHRRCHAGQSWRWDDVRFEMLSPSLDSYAQDDVKDNNRSCVLRVTSRYGSVLLPGDIERKEESLLLEIAGDELAADVLLAPHHGSGTSSSPAFLAAIHPALTVFTVGYRNRFGHPKPAVVKRYVAVGSDLYRSDTDGAVLLRFSQAEGVTATRWRSQARRYWHDRFDTVPALAEKTAAR